MHSVTTAISISVADVFGLRVAAQGARYIYQTYIKPFLDKHHQRIETKIMQLIKVIVQAILQILEYIRTRAHDWPQQVRVPPICSIPVFHIFEVMSILRLVSTGTVWFAGNGRCARLFSRTPRYAS